MNRGINDSQDLPAEYLEGIYDEISANEIKMRYDKGELTRVNAAREIILDFPSFMCFSSYNRSFGDLNMRIRY